MHVFRRSEPGLWTVGYYEPNGDWYAIEDFPTRAEAAKLVHYLNGGVAEAIYETGRAAGL